jgi:hypothetical protein
VYDLADDGSLTGAAGPVLSTPDGQHSSAPALRGDRVAGQVADNLPVATSEQGPNPSHLDAR